MINCILQSMDAGLILCTWRGKVIFPWQRAPLWGICKFLLGLLKGHQGKEQGQRRQLPPLPPLPPLSIRPVDVFNSRQLLIVYCLSEHYFTPGNVSVKTKCLRTLYCIQATCTCIYVHMFVQCSNGALRKWTLRARVQVIFLIDELPSHLA